MTAHSSGVVQAHTKSGMVKLILCPQTLESMENE